ncbi:hypothetical protein A2U11_10035 [Fusobacterium necrophorum subsp. funduliforme]|uniref:hypothetical protein n=1 Tax=Fusobacterium necrophorum TaxID=859 RepID=UPI0007889FC1|nr:hypothetical protein [Fusobacterium necrophorum]KYM48114.1 hypothetical protein A2U04_05150 [Fusobacterium necrophorum subsp. funduliforme]KYM49753.1 hypothetical protein A2U11_10035 [Fusobacterium necrophorum subsp. funduliforme]
MRTVEEIREELKKQEDIKADLEKEFDETSITELEYLDDLDKELYKTESMIELLVWVLGEC